MSKYVINVGSAANDGTGDPIRTAFTGINANFTAAYNAARWRPIVKGAVNWYPPHYVASTGLFGVVANNMYFLPHPIGWDGTIVDLSICVTTAVASTHCKVALFRDSAGVPGTKIADLTGTAVLDCSTTGVKGCVAAGNTVSAAVSAGDIVWTGLVFDGAPTLLGLSNTTFSPWYYWTDPGGGGQWTKNCRYISTGSSYATGLPADATTLSSQGPGNSGSNPITCLAFS